jgi:elongation factor G
MGRGPNRGWPKEGVRGAAAAACPAFSLSPAAAAPPPPALNSLPHSSHACPHQVYSGTVKKGDFVVNSTNGKRVRVPRLVRVHSDELEDIPSAVRPGGVGGWRGQAG